MNEFEWLKQTRALDRPVEPRRNLWPGIAARIEATAIPSPARPSRLLPWAMAAALAALSVLAGVLAWRQQALPTMQAGRQAILATATTTPPHENRATPPFGSRATSVPWKPRDPRLAGAAIELDIARRQLVRAIHAAPRDTYLQHMLAHTDRQLDRLQQLDRRAG